MTKSIEQSPVCECKPPMVNQDGICMICKKIYVADHIKQYLIRAGYLKAIEVLKGERRIHGSFLTNYFASAADFLEKKLNDGSVL